MPPQQRQRPVDVVGGRLNFGAHGLLRVVFLYVIRAEAGIQSDRHNAAALDHRFRMGDDEF